MTPTARFKTLKSSSDILTYCPREPRPIQREILEHIQRDYDRTDVFVLNLPTGLGKTFIAMTLARWLHKEKGVSSSIITPTNILRDQYTTTYPKLHTLSRADMYDCHNFETEGYNCKQVKVKTKTYCSDCTCKSAQKKSYVVPYGVYNNYLYLAHKLYKKALISDESHNLVKLLQDRAADRLWQHDYMYPNNLSSYKDLIEWLRLRESTLGLDTKQQKLLDELTSTKPRFVIEAGEEPYRGEYRRCLRMLPVDVRDSPPILWPPSKVKKIFLLSATIAKPDIEQLGLDKLRVRYYTATSPVDATHRPVIFRPVGSMSIAFRARTLAALVAEIASILEKESGKGLIHATYEIAEMLRANVGDAGGRLMYHTKENKARIVQAFKDGRPGTVLVGSGLEEGLDLPGDLARWQIITRVPWPSLAEPAIAFKAGTDPEWFMWETVKSLLQACGRIVRSTDDFGRTYILDSSFDRVLREGKHFLPDWWLDGLLQETK